MTQTIPATAQRLITDWRLGFVATADEEGTPNVSPKGTFVVLDDHRLAFAEMRSPRTVANLEIRPATEVNFVDVLTRRGVRLRGTARIVAAGTDEFTRLLPEFTALWPDLESMFNAIVVIDVEACRPLLSPAYEAGATETDLRTVWRAKIRAMADG